MESCDDHEMRIRALELKTANFSNKELDLRLREVEHTSLETQIEIQSLNKSLNSLTNWIKTLTLVIVGGMVSSFGYLIVYWVKN